MVAVWRCGHLKSMCTREFGFAQSSVDAIDTHWIHIEFALGNSVTEPVWIRIQCELQAFRGVFWFWWVVKIRLLMDPMPVQKIALMLPNEPWTLNIAVHLSVCWFCKDLKFWPTVWLCSLMHWCMYLATSRDFQSLNNNDASTHTLLLISHCHRTKAFSDKTCWLVMWEVCFVDWNNHLVSILF